MSQYLDLVKQYGWKPEGWIGKADQYITDPGRYGDYGKLTGKPDFRESTISGIKNELKSTGLSDNEVTFVINILGGQFDASDRARDLYRQTVADKYGSTYDVEKYWGSIGNLATYLASGGRTKQIAAEPADYNNQRGGKLIYVKEDGSIATPTGTVAANDVTQLYAQYLGRDATPQEIAVHAGKTKTEDILNWLKQQKYEGTPGFTPDIFNATPQAPVVNQPPVTPATPQYVRQSGTTDVYNTQTGQYVTYEEANKNNIWNQVQDVSDISKYGVKQSNLNTLTGPTTPSTTTDLNAGNTDAYNPPTPTATSTIDSYNQSLLVDLENKKRELEKEYQNQLKATQTKIDEAQKKQDELLAQQKDILETDVKPLTEPFRADIETAERERLKIEENYFANQQLTNELGTLLTQIQGDLQAAKDVTGLAAIRNPRIQKATEDATARVGVIEAVMAARNNQITVGENLIDRTVTAMTADRNDQLSYYNSLLSFYDKQVTAEGNKIINLTKQEQDWIKAKVGLLESEVNNAQANADYIKQLMINPDTALAMGQAGVTLNDSPEQINAKLSQYAYTQEVKDTSNTMTTNGYKSILPQEVTSKPANEVITTTDSKGNVSYWWKPAEIETDTITSNGRNLLINKKTGEIIKDLGSSTTGGGTSGIGILEAVAQDAIDAGASVQEAFAEALTMANSSGLSLTLKEQNNLYNNIKNMKKTTTETTAPTPETPYVLPPEAKTTTILGMTYVQDPDKPNDPNALLTVDEYRKKTENKQTDYDIINSQDIFNSLFLPETEQPKGFKI
jgi:hypothetical protein